MVAMLQARTGSEAPILLRYHIQAGHSGGQTADQQVDELTALLGFLQWRLGRERR
jgi:hypothetical protein